MKSRVSANARVLAIVSLLIWNVVGAVDAKVSATNYTYEFDPSGYSSCGSVSNAQLRLVMSGDHVRVRVSKCYSQTFSRDGVAVLYVNGKKYYREDGSLASESYSRGDSYVTFYINPIFDGYGSSRWYTYEARVGEDSNLPTGVVNGRSQFSVSTTTPPFPNYTYQVSPGESSCGSVSNTKLKFVPEGSSIRVEVTKCIGPFQRNGEGVVYVDGQVYGISQTYAQGVSSFSFYIDPAREGLPDTEEHTYLVKVGEDANLATGTVTAKVVEAQPGPTYQVTGQIVNGLNIGIDGVLVSIGNKSSLTNNDGCYTITGLSGGVYSPGVSKTGYGFSNFPAIINLTGDMSIDAIGHYTNADVDSGFLPNPNGFSFINQGYSYEDNANSWTLFKRAFPATEMENSDGSRKQAAEQFFLNTFLEIGAGGHCRGFSHASLVYYSGLKSLEQTEDDVLLSPNDTSGPFDMIWRADSKEYLHIYQARWYTSGASEKRRWGDPNSVLQLVKDALADFQDNALDLVIYDYAQRGAHSVVPYRVEDQGVIDRIYVYDNNHPNSTQKFIEINTATNTWQYNIWGTTFWSGAGSSMYVELAKNNFPGAVDLNANMSVMMDGDVSTIFVDDYGRRLGMVGNDIVNEIPNARIEIIPTYSPNNPSAEDSTVVYRLPMNNDYTLQVYANSSGAYTMTAFASDRVVAINGLESSYGATNEIDLSGNMRDLQVRAAVGSGDYCFLFADDGLEDASRSFNLCTTTALGGAATFSVANDNNSLAYKNNGQANDYVLKIVQTGQLAGTQILTGNMEGNSPLFITATPGDGPGGSEWIADTGNAIYLPLVVKEVGPH